MFQPERRLNVSPSFLFLGEAVRMPLRLTANWKANWRCLTPLRSFIFAHFEITPLRSWTLFPRRGMTRPSPQPSPTVFKDSTSTLQLRVQTREDRVHPQDSALQVRAYFCFLSQSHSFTQIVFSHEIRRIPSYSSSGLAEG